MVQQLLVRDSKPKYRFVVLLSNTFVLGSDLRIERDVSLRLQKCYIISPYGAVCAVYSRIE